MSRVGRAASEDNRTRDQGSRAPVQEETGIMRELVGQFRRDFGHWGIVLPPDAVKGRRRGKILAAGWAIWYLFESDERGEYLDYYACHRMTGDRHVRIREDGSEEDLPTVESMRPASREPQEDARLRAEHLAQNRRVAKMLEKKGFGMEGDEPGGVQINRYLVLGRDDWNPNEGRRRT